MADELPIPAEVLKDPDSFEIIRVWAAHGEQFVTLQTGFAGGPSNFGGMLADLIQHGARLYSQRENIAVFEALEQIVSGMRDELRRQTHEITGSIAHDA
jgi:hypothetical protein